MNILHRFQIRAHVRSLYLFANKLNSKGGNSVNVIDMFSNQHQN